MAKKSVANDVARIIEARLRELDMKKTEFARKLGVTDGYIHKILAVGLLPAPDMVNKIVEVLGLEHTVIVNEILRIRFAGLLKDYGIEGSATRKIVEIYAPQKASQIPAGLAYPVAADLPTDRSFDIVSGQFKTDEDENGEVLAKLPGKGCYAVRIADGSMLPFLPKGAMLIADPLAKAVDGDLVVIQFHKTGGDIGFLEEHPDENLLVIRKPAGRGRVAKWRSPQFVHKVVSVLYPGPAGKSGVPSAGPSL